MVPAWVSAGNPRLENFLSMSSVPEPLFHLSTDNCFMRTQLFLILFIYFQREGKEQRKRGRETSVCGCLSCGLHWGPGLQLRHVPWLGIKPAIPWFTACAQSTELYQPGQALRSYTTRPSFTWMPIRANGKGRSSSTTGVAYIYTGSPWFKLSVYKNEFVPYCTNVENMEVQQFYHFKRQNWLSRISAF